MEVVDKLITKILTSTKGVYFVITGGGTRAISLLLENGGASSVFIGARVPYSQKETSDITWGVTKTVSQKCSEALSKVALDVLIEREKVGVCISSTSSLRKAGAEREGRIHEAYISIREFNSKGVEDKVKTYHIEFNEDRTRLDEENMLSYLILAITCQSTTKCDWSIETHTKMLRFFGFTDKDKIQLLKQEKANKEDETDE